MSARKFAVVRRRKTRNSESRVPHVENESITDLCQADSPQSEFPFGQTATANHFFGFPRKEIFGKPELTNALETNPSFKVITIKALAGTSIKFDPVHDTDTMIKKGMITDISTKCYSITVMKEYEDKSFEELRLEDYTVGRKGAYRKLNRILLFRH